MIDPNILLQGKNPVIESPRDAAAGAQNLQNLSNQGQIQQGQIAAQPAQLEAQQLQNQQTQQQINQTKTINDAYANALTPGSNGAPATFDTAKLQNALATHNAGSAIPGLMKSIMDSQKAATDLAAQKNKLATDQADYFGAIGKTAKDAGYNPQVLVKQAQQGISAGAIDPSVAQPIIAEITQSLQTDPTGAQAANLTKQLADHLISMSPAQQKLANEAQTAQGAAQRGAAAEGELTLKQTQAATQDAATRLSQAKTPQDYAAILNTLPHGIAIKFPAAESWNAQTTPQAALQAGMTPDQITQSEQRKEQLAKFTTQAELANAAAKGDPDAKAALDLLQKQNIAERQASNPSVSVNLTPGGQAIYDKSLQTTGQPIAIPRGPGGAQVVSALNRLGAAAPDTNLGATKADYKADSSSLTKLQGQSDALDAYGAKFIGNLNQMKNIASQLPDSGSPYLNVPVRMLDEKLLGKDVYGRFNVARTIAANEGGRILSGGGNLGGVVSDNARNEISTLLDKNATLGQWMTAADQLNKDYAITKKAMSDQLTTIKGRIAGSSSGAAPAAANTYAATATGAGGHKVGTNDGGKTWFDVQTGKQVQ